jgi:hypothetical protein
LNIEATKFIHHFQQLIKIKEDKNNLSKRRGEI